MNIVSSQVDPKNRVRLELPGYAVRWDPTLSYWAIFPRVFRGCPLVRLESGGREHPSVWSCFPEDLDRVLELLR